MEDCILWAGNKDRWGYGLRHFEGKMRLAHRVAFAVGNGVSIDSIAGKVIRHKCDVPLCCNPAHLEIGTHADNMKDKVDRGRMPVGEALPFSKLSEKAVVEIRGKRAAGIKLKDLAESYGVTLGNIRAVVTRKTWKHVK